MIKVVIDGERINIDEAAQLGVDGGEGRVFRTDVNGKPMAVKIYNDNRLDGKEEKLNAFLSNMRGWYLPTDKIAVPEHLARDPRTGNVIGFAMQFMDRAYSISQLAQKKWRASLSINARVVANIFLDGAGTIQTIHKNGIVIGDFSDSNILFRSADMLFIDVDSWQFGQFSCMGQKDRFRDPQWSGRNWVITNDWYSFEVILFKSLLLVHPFRGKHPTIQQTPERMRQGIIAYAPGIIRLDSALPWDMLDDELAHEFTRVLVDGERHEFPIGILERYRDNLGECPDCHEYYPQSRTHCPKCGHTTFRVVRTPKPDVVQLRAIQRKELLQTEGSIVFSKVVGTTVHAITYEHGKAVLYTKRDGQTPFKRTLFDEIKGATYDITGDTLIVNPPFETSLFLFDISGMFVHPIVTTDTALYQLGERTAVFQSSGSDLYRICGNNIVAGHVQNGKRIETIIRPIEFGQTWFTVEPDTDPKVPTIAGFFGTVRQQRFWMVWNGMPRDNLPVSPLEPREEVALRWIFFAPSGIVIRRITMRDGDFANVYTDLVNAQGESVKQIKVPFDQHHAPYPEVLHGLSLLSTSDEGILSEDLDSGEISVLSGTKGLVSAEDQLRLYKGGVLVEKDNAILHVDLTRS